MKYDAAFLRWTWSYESASERKFLKEQGIVMKKTLLLLVCFCTIFTFIAVAAVKCSFSIEAPANIGSVELKSGTYDVRVDESTATITPKSGKSFTAPVKIETLEKKWSGETAINSSTKDGKRLITSIMVGHSKTKIVFAQ
jgi:hypothetical protein